MTKKKDPKDYLKIGRPPLYNKELGEKICRVVSATTDSIKKICQKNPDFPSYTVIHEWRLDYPEFADQYANARRNQAELLAQEILEISDDSSQDMIETENGIKFNSEFAARARLRVDSRKWIACKLLPKIYGDKIQSETTVTISHEDRLKELK